jgi:ureidoacrylate peracid hydrolase
MDSTCGILMSSVEESGSNVTPQPHDSNGGRMNPEPHDCQATALLVIDPYNDFISEGGKVWNRIKAVAEANRCIPNMLEVLQAARRTGVRVFYALHRRYRPGDY